MVKTLQNVKKHLLNHKIMWFNLSMAKSLKIADVKKAIEQGGLKKKWVAEKIGVSSNTLSEFLSGRKNMGKSAQILLAQVLKLHDASDKAS